MTSQALHASFPPGGNEGRQWASQRRAPAGEVAVLAVRVPVHPRLPLQPRSGSGLPAWAVSCPAPTRASQAVDSDWKRIMQTHSWIKLGSRPEEQQGKSPGGALVQREHGLGLVVREVAWGGAML